MTYKAARQATSFDFEAMLRLPERPGRNSVGSRSLAFTHPNHSPETLGAYFAAFPQGVFVSEEDDQIISFSCAIRTSIKSIEEPMVWSDATGDGTKLAHMKEGEWLYVSRLAYTAGRGHAPLSNEIGPLLTALQELAVRLHLKGVAFPARFLGFRERSGTTNFQKSIVDEESSVMRSAMQPLSIALHAGFHHEIALPNYLGDARHFAMMVWRKED